MKISKTAVLAMGCVFTAAGLGLTVATAVAGNDNEKTLNVDLKNAVQHIEEVIFISSGSSNSPEAIAQQVGDRLVGIETDRFVLSKDENSNKITTSVGKKGDGSSILGGKSNKMEGGAYNVILAGSGNEMKKGTRNTILGGERNQTNGETTNTSWSTIIGGKDNTIEGNHSVTVGGHDNSIKGNKSTIVGNNSSVTGNNSTALGLNSKINASGSFLWTDGEEGYGELAADNVFAVMSRSGMVINTKKAHPLAQLTIGNPMIVYESRKSEGIKCEDNQGGGIMKVVKNGGNANQVCFCSCDGSGWNSLFGGRGACQNYCQGTTHKEPKCGGFVQYKASTNDKKRFSGSCEVGEVLEGTGAYLVTSDGKIHWSCQTEDGSVTPCIGQIGSEENSWQPYQYQCIGSFEHAYLVHDIGDNPDDNVDSTLYETEADAGDKKCSYVCDNGYEKEGNECIKMPPQDGKCGSTHYECTAGTLNGEEYDGNAHKYTWQCVGINEGNTANCYENEKVNGVCNNSVINGCTAGTFSDVADTSTQYKWKCEGINEGNDASCSKDIPQKVNGVCGTTVNSCTAGTFSDVADTSTQYKWKCEGSNGGNDASCSKNIPVNGSCGTTVNSCAAGTFSDVADTSTQYKWKCVGSNGGNDASCSKNIPDLKTCEQLGGTYSTSPSGCSEEVSVSNAIGGKCYINGCYQIGIRHGDYTNASSLICKSHQENSSDIGPLVNGFYCGKSSSSLDLWRTEHTGPQSCSSNFCGSDVEPYGSCSTQGTICCYGKNGYNMQLKCAGKTGGQKYFCSGKYPSGNYIGIGNYTYNPGATTSTEWHYVDKSISQLNPCEYTCIHGQSEPYYGNICRNI